MRRLLPHYERELALLRTQADEFAQQYPRIAGRLSVRGEVLQDPHVERMIQAFALLSARIHKRLDDDFPQFTEAFLDLLYPHYLRPFPSCSIACFEPGDNAPQMTHAQCVPRGLQARSAPLRGVKCRFVTVAEAQLLPVRVASASFQGVVSVPDGTPVPRQATAMLSIRFERLSSQARWSDLGTDHLRLYLDGDASLVTLLRETLTSKVAGVAVQTTEHGPWTRDPDARPRHVGLDDSEPLIAFDARSHPAYRLLTEYFAYPERFNFIDLPLPAAAGQCRGDGLGLHFMLTGLPTDGDEAHLLELVSARNFVLGCAPVVNVFHTHAEPIRLTQASDTYPVLPDGRRAFGHEVYAVDRVFRVRQTVAGETVQEFKPFYSLHHEDLLREGEGGGRYWYAQRNPAVASRSPGFDMEIGVVDIGFDPAAAQTDTLSIAVRATNRDLPHLMSIGNPDGDLFVEGGGSWRAIRLMRRPTRSHRFEAGKGALWRLISQLSLNHLSLSDGGLEALKELLRLYDLPRSPHNSRMLEGLVGVAYRPTQACISGNPYTTVVRGTQVDLTVDEGHFVGSGLVLFSRVLDRFFGLYAHVNSFTQLRVLSSRTREVLVACPRRSGDTTLL